MQLPGVEWKPISRVQFLAWIAFYTVLLSFLATHFREMTLLDNVHLPIHEGGHLFFSYFGEPLQLWGGTIFQLLIPALLCASFVSKGDAAGVTFCAFGFFHSLGGVATYMSDAIVRELPLVTVGGVGSDCEHDWYHIFSQLGVLPHAVQIGSATRVIAWIGLLASVGWFWRRYRTQGQEQTLTFSACAQIGSKELSS